MATDEPHARVLLVGAGAMGRVLARHLRRASCDVSFFHAQRAVSRPPQELVYYPLNDRNARAHPRRMACPPVYTDHAELRDQYWEQVFLCVPSQALRGDLLMNLSASVGSATVVKVQPGLFDRARISRYVPESRIVDMFLSFAGYDAPLDGEDVPVPGLAYWLPPLAPSLVHVSSRRARVVLEMLKRGRIRVRHSLHVDMLVRFTLAFQAPICAVFARTDISFGDGFEERWLGLAVRGSREAIAVAEQHIGCRAPFPLRHVSQDRVLWILRGLRAVTPFAVDAYLKAHYRKLAEQSRSHVDDYIEAGRRYGLPTGALEEIRSEMGTMVGRVAAH